MQASLTFPRNATLISGDNPVYIGNVNRGESRTVNWTLVFIACGVFNLDVNASGYRKDTGGYVENHGYATVTVVDTAPPIILILSPQNTTYPTSDVLLNFTVNETTDWMGYCLDGQANVTVTGNTTLTDLPDGTHLLKVYVNDTCGNMGLDEICFTVDLWKTVFIGLGGFPIADFAFCNEKLYAASDNTLYVYNGSSWNIIDAPTYVTSLMCYEDKLISGGQDGLCSYNGTAFNLILPVSGYIKTLGIYNNTLYAGTVLDKPPTLLL